jgi:hypothetical protein
MPSSLAPATRCEHAAGRRLAVRLPTPVPSCALPTLSRVEDRVECLICLACAVRLPRSLEDVGALRCHDCVDEEVPVSVFVVRLQTRLIRIRKVRRAA